MKKERTNGDDREPKGMNSWKDDEMRKTADGTRREMCRQGGADLGLKNVRERRSVCSVCV